MKDLAILGLGKNEAKLYHALLKLKKSNAGELAKDSGVPPSRVYDYLESLIEKGFVKIFPGKTKQFIPASPEEFKEILKNKRHELDNTEKVMDELLQIYKSNPSQPIEFAIGKRGFWKILEEVPRNENYNYTIKWNADYTSKLVRNYKIRKKNKKIKSLTMARFNDETKNNVKKWVKLGQKIKPIENEGVVIEVGEKYVFITLLETNGTLLIKDIPFTKIMRDLLLTKYKTINEDCKTLLEKSKDL